MPRVNRDLQRRLAARRERERRRPSTERRYRFTTSEPGLDLEPDDEARVEQDGSAADVEGEVAPPPATRAARSMPLASSTRTAVRPAARPFSAYKDEYAYVSSDLRRVAAVIGGLLVALVILYFALPNLVH